MGASAFFNERPLLRRMRWRAECRMGGNETPHAPDFGK